MTATASFSCRAGDEGCCHCQFTAGTLFLELEAYLLYPSFQNKSMGKRAMNAATYTAVSSMFPCSGVLRICLAQANTRWYDHLADSTPQGHEPESPVPLIVECMFGSLVPHVGVAIFGSEGHL